MKRHFASKVVMFSAVKSKQNIAKIPHFSTQPQLSLRSKGGTCWDKEPFMKLMSRLCLPMRNRFVKAKAKTAEIYESYQTHWGTSNSHLRNEKTSSSLRNIARIANAPGHSLTVSH